MLLHLLRFEMRQKLQNWPAYSIIMMEGAMLGLLWGALPSMTGANAIGQGSLLIVAFMLWQQLPVVWGDDIHQGRMEILLQEGVGLPLLLAKYIGIVASLILQVGIVLPVLWVGVWDVTLSFKELAVLCLILGLLSVVWGALGVFIALLAALENGPYQSFMWLLPCLVPAILTALYAFQTAQGLWYVLALGAIICPLSLLFAGMALRTLGDGDTLGFKS